jgi:hypothetical protein
MASILKVDTLTGVTTAKTITVTVGSSATQSLEQGILKAWTVNASSASGTVGDSLNNSSFSDEGTGRTLITTANPMNTAQDYCVSYSAVSGYPYRGKADTASTYKLETVNDSGNYADGISNGMVSGDLA